MCHLIAFLVDNFQVIYKKRRFISYLQKVFTKFLLLALDVSKISRLFNMDFRKTIKICLIMEQNV